MGLFREEALNAEKEKLLGHVVLSSPVSLRFFVAFVICLLVGLVLFIGTFSYTSKQTVMGQLVPDLGLIKVYSPQYGTITEVYVKEGDFVTRGDPLYVISSDRDVGNNQGIQEVISNEINNRLALYHNELGKLQEQSAIETNSMEKNISQLKEQLAVLNKQIDNYNQIVSLTTRRQNQYQELYKKNYISLEQVERVKEEQINSLMNLNNLKREIINTEKEIQTRTSELDSLDSKYRQQVSQYERNISTANQELAESESRREIMIQAPQSGTVTALSGQIGLYVDGKRQLVSIIPEGSILQAHLYAPSEAVGFIKENFRVYMRYQAFPYQKFGQYGGAIESISKTALPKAELTDFVTATDYNPNVSLYRIVVKLDSQTIRAYGETKPLQAGMFVDADIAIDKRKLYEWVFEPLFTVGKKF